MQQFEQFGKYILLEKLAAGGMAEVYLAKSTGANGVNKFLAIKRILPQFSENTEFIDMFKEEAKIAVNLNHSNVVSIYDFGIERNQFFLVMEYVEGRNLRQIVNETKKNNYKFTVEQLVYMIKEVAAGLDHAHRCIDGSTGKPLNITHRDMSPQNIMVSFEGEVKIIDFGIAKAETQLEATKAGTLKGKFGYMSPEQAEGHVVDLRTDIFSLGIVLWELLANDRLFAASSEAAILRKIRECEVPSIRKIIPSIPAELERIVLKALTKDRNLRYQTAAAMHRDLNRFLNTQYPEFTPHDFSVFVKNTFAQAYQNQKQKLVEYSQVQLSGPTSNSQSVNDKTIVDTGNSEEANGLGLNTDFRQKVELLDLNGPDKEVLLSTARPQNYQNNPMPQRPPPGAQKAKPRSSTATYYRKKSTFPSWVSLAIIIAMLFGGATWYLKIPLRDISRLDVWKNHMADRGFLEMASQNPLNPTPTPVPAEPVVAKPVLYHLTLKSNPSGAKIYVDGLETADMTPAMLQLPSDRESYVTLKKDGFLPYEKTFKLVRDAESFEATLQSQPAAYLSVDITLGAGSSPYIEINGQRLGEKPPLVKYAVPANTNIVVRGVNPYTKAHDEQTIKLAPGERKEVKLILRVDSASK